MFTKKEKCLICNVCLQKKKVREREREMREGLYFQLLEVVLWCGNLLPKFLPGFDHKVCTWFSLTCLPHDASTNSWLNVICEVKTKEILQIFSVIEGHITQIHIFLGPFIFIFFPWSSSLTNRRTLHIKHTLVVICTKNGSRLPLSLYWGWITQGIIQPKVWHQKHWVCA